MQRSASILFTLLVVFLALFSLTGLAGASRSAGPLAPLAGAPSVVSYQGQVSVSGTPYTGTGHFRFAVVHPLTAAMWVTDWSNDGTSVIGGEPANAVTLSVSNGLFNVLLGDTSLMSQPLPAAVFSGSDRTSSACHTGGDGDLITHRCRSMNRQLTTGWVALVLGAPGIGGGARPD